MLPQLSGEQRHWLADFATRNHRHEAALAAHLIAMAPASFPWPHIADRTRSSERDRATIPFGAQCDAKRIISTLGALLARLSRDGGTDVAFALPPVPAFAQPLICSEK